MVSKEAMNPSCVWNIKDNTCKIFVSIYFDFDVLVIFTL